MGVQTEAPVAREPTEAMLAGRSFSVPGAAARRGSSPGPGARGGAPGAPPGAPPAPPSPSPSGDPPLYFSVLYTKYSQTKLRKNKSWNDGVLEVRPGKPSKVTLHDDGSKAVAAGALRGCEPRDLGQGSSVLLGSWEVEVDEAVDPAKFRSGEVFLGASCVGGAAKAAAKGAGGGRVVGGLLPGASSVSPTGLSSARPSPWAAPRAADGTPAGGFKPVGLAGSGRPGGGAGGAASAPPRPRPPAFAHDPLAPGALVLYHDGEAPPRADRGEAGLAPAPLGAAEALARLGPLAAVVDPKLARALRPHQREGVEFLFRRVSRGGGCILADEMGLGKTLQVLALIWTLLRQGGGGAGGGGGGAAKRPPGLAVARPTSDPGDGGGPRPSSSLRPLARKALVVAPTTLVRGWWRETRRWLGDERLVAHLLEPGKDGATVTRDFAHGAARELLVTSYELARAHASTLRGRVDVLVCDEAHRLKSAAGSKTLRALESLGAPRRVLLTGTPVQNAPREFFAMADFALPGALGTLGAFERVFGAPIARSRDRDASPEEVCLGRERGAELARRVGDFVLRRTAAVHEDLLPPCRELLLFCAMAPAQLERYRAALATRRGSARPDAGGDAALPLLARLRTICNHPWLDRKAAAAAATAALGPPDGDRRQDVSDGKSGSEGSGGDEAIEAFSPSIRLEDSGKMAVLAALLATLADLGERCVVVSQSTEALRLVEAWCGQRGLSTCRLDGSVAARARHEAVEAFQRPSGPRVFLLSTAAGGAGLTLTAASRLILLDCHWNPALDLQAAGRIWRPGQTRPCVIYRLLTAGAIDEKIFQRQQRKGELAAGLGMAGRPGDDGAVPDAPDAGSSAGGETPDADASTGSSAGVAALERIASRGGKFADEDLRMLFELRTDTVCDTRDLVEEALPGGFAAAPRDDPLVYDPALLAAWTTGSLTFVHLASVKGGAGAAGAGGTGEPQTAAAGAGLDEAAEALDGRASRPRPAARASPPASLAPEGGESAEGDAVGAAGEEEGASEDEGTPGGPAQAPPPSTGTAGPPAKRTRAAVGEASRAARQAPNG